MSAAQVESEITTLEWILDKEYSSKHIEQLWVGSRDEG
jgi:hypothetical protein